MRIAALLSLKPVDFDKNEKLIKYYREELEALYFKASKTGYIKRVYREYVAALDKLEKRDYRSFRVILNQIKRVLDEKEALTNEDENGKEYPCNDCALVTIYEAYEFFLSLRSVEKNSIYKMFYNYDGSGLLYITGAIVKISTLFDFYAKRFVSAA